MPDKPEPPPAGQIPKFTDPLGQSPGRFCTLFNIGHTAEFFALDLRTLTPEGEACLLGRFFLTPQHTKRLVHALVENINNFEKQHGIINAEGPAPGGIQGSN
jgi:hypothetical protein